MSRKFQFLSVNHSKIKKVSIKLHSPVNFCWRFSSTILHCYRLWFYNTEQSSLLYLAWKVTLARHRIWREKLKAIFTSFMHLCNTGSWDNKRAHWEEMEHYGVLRKRKENKDNQTEVWLAQKWCLPPFRMLCNEKKKRAVSSTLRLKT